MDDELRHHMYVVECADGSWYTGYATDVERRVAAHNAGRGAKYTKVRRPVVLLASAAFESKHEAMSAEFRFKRLSRPRKAELLELARGCDGGLREALRREFGVKLLEAPMDNNLAIRLATPADAEVIARIEAACFPPAEAASLDQFVERLAVFANHFWLLERDGEVVTVINGMVSDAPTICDAMFEDAHLHNEQGAWQEIFGVMALPEYQGRGYANVLMKRVIADARAQGRRGCVLTCKAELVGFYERFGYRNLGVSASERGGATWYDMRLEF